MTEPGDATRVEEVRPQVGQLDLELVGPVSQIMLDGEIIVHGDDGAPLFVDPGEHVVEVRWFSGAVDAQRVTVVAGATQSLRFQARDEPRPVPVYGAPAPPRAFRGCGCDVPGASSASPSGNDGGPPVPFAVVASAVAAAIVSRRRPR